MAVPGTTSAYTAQCLHDLVSNDTGLVLVEPSVGDWGALDQPHEQWREQGVRSPLNNSIRLLIILGVVQQRIPHSAKLPAETLALSGIRITSL